MATTTLQDDPESYFLSQQKMQLHFTNMNENLDPELSIKEELVTLQEQFSKLKADYLFLETKQGVLNALSKKIPEVVQINAQATQLEAEVNETKGKIESVKKDIKETKKALRAIIPVLTSGYEKLQKKNQELVDVYDKENSAQVRNFIQDASELNNSTDRYGKSDPKDMSMDDLHKCHSILGNQTSALLDLQGKEAEVENRAKELSDVLAPLELKVKELEEKVRAYEDEKLARGEAIDRDNINLKKQESWYTSALKVVNNFAGFSVDITSDSSLAVAFAGGIARLEIKYDAQNQNIQDVTLEMAEGESCPNIKDIVEACVPTNDQSLNLLLTEVQQRVSRWNSRCQSIKQLRTKSRLSMEWKDPEIRIQFVGSNPLDFVVCCLHLSPDYPSPCDSALITSLDRSIDSTWTQAQLDVIMDDINANSPKCMLPGFIEHVQDTLYSIPSQ